MWLFAGARGPHIFKDWKQKIRKGVFLTPEGDRSLSEQFNTWKDIVIAGLEPDEPFWSGKLAKKPYPRNHEACVKLSGAGYIRFMNGTQ